MDSEEWQEVQAKGIENKFNEIIAENFPNLKRWSSRHWSLLGLQKDKTRKDSPHIILH
jgi:hypothetical protein